MVLEVVGGLPSHNLKVNIVVDGNGPVGRYAIPTNATSTMYDAD